MTQRPETRYAKSGDVHIAYQVTGEGPLDLVYIPGFVSHLEYQWEYSASARFLERLGSFARVIRFDKRGTGLSDRGPIPTLEQRMDDVRVVMDAVGSERAALFGISCEVLVSGTVRDLVAGSGLRFSSRGTHALKGVPGEWPLFAVEQDAVAGRV